MSSPEQPPRPPPPPIQTKTAVGGGSDTSCYDAKKEFPDNRSPLSAMGSSATMVASQESKSATAPGCSLKTRTSSFHGSPIGSGGRSTTCKNSLRQRSNELPLYASPVRRRLTPEAQHRKQPSTQQSESRNGVVDVSRATQSPSVNIPPARAFSSKLSDGLSPVAPGESTPPTEELTGSKQDIQPFDGIHARGGRRRRTPSMESSDRSVSSLGPTRSIHPGMNDHDRSALRNLSASAPHLSLTAAATPSYSDSVSSVRQNLFQSAGGECGQQALHSASLNSGVATRTSYDNGWKWRMLDTTSKIVIMCSAVVWACMTVTIHEHVQVFVTPNVDSKIAKLSASEPSPTKGAAESIRTLYGWTTGVVTKRTVSENWRRGSGDTKSSQHASGEERSLTHPRVAQYFDRATRYDKDHINNSSSGRLATKNHKPYQPKLIKTWSIMSHRVSIPFPGSKDEGGEQKTSRGRTIKLYPAEYSDPTQVYHLKDSSDEIVRKNMERWGHDSFTDSSLECQPMEEWQTTFYPTCNSMHEVDLLPSAAAEGGSMTKTELFGTKGYWRDAWKLERKVSKFSPSSGLSLGIRSIERGDRLPQSPNHTDAQAETVALKTIKYMHRFEEKYYEQNRIDAVAMERLTASPFVVDVYGFCGQSVFTEYASGPRFGQVADKMKGWQKVRLARDLAQAVADVHSVDENSNRGATLAHFDVNLANVIAVNSTHAKLNDFNIAVLMRWNKTADEPCGFPAKYPNPQWRSPEEALNHQNLTEKVDVYSLGNIFFRLICKHEPWNKLEQTGDSKKKPSKEYINERMRRGKLPYVPPSVRKSTDPATVAIRKAMAACYAFDPVKRPSARSVVRYLNNALSEWEQSVRESTKKKQ